jgi:REP element-mobilizing transposase RayT
MPRRLRIEFEGAIYHVMARGNARQDIVDDDGNRRRLLDDLERTVVRSGWELPAFVVLSDHLHLLVKNFINKHIAPNAGNLLILKEVHFRGSCTNVEFPYVVYEH